MEGRDKDSQGGRSNEVGWTKVSFVGWEQGVKDCEKMRIETMEAKGGRQLTAKGRRKKSRQDC